MLKIRTVIATALIILSFSVILPAFAVSHLGGDWSYGGNHDPGNWGAFSNYHHALKNHWSYVGSGVRRNEKYASALSGYYSYAFINTNIGEYVTFKAGL